MSKLYTLVYQDSRQVRFLKDYKTGLDSVVLARPGQELVVNEAQKEHLLKRRNGDRPCFRLKTEGGDADGSR